jgi:hypothetical protein
MKKQIYCSLVCCLWIVSCVPQEEVAQGVENTLAARQAPTDIPTYTDNPTYTPYPTYTMEKTATPTSTITKTPNLTASARPTVTQTPTQSFDGTGAMTATWIQNHIPGQTFVDESCGISFEYPLEWTVEYSGGYDPERFACLYGLKPDNYLQIVENSNKCMSDHAIQLGGVNTNFQDAAGAWGFYYENGHWWSSGGKEPMANADIIATRGLVILRAVNTMEMWDTECSYRIGLQEYDIAVINNGGDKSIVMMDDSMVFNLHFEYILQTIKIL